MINEAFFVLGEGVASAQGYRHGDGSWGVIIPSAPWPWRILSVWTRSLHVIEGLHEEFGDKYLPAPYLKILVRAGRLGKKSGKGVYDYA